MPDITMCKNSRCSLNASCYRYTAKPDFHRQAYFVDLEPIINEDGDTTCEYYYPFETCPHCGGIDYHYTNCVTRASL